MAALIPDEKNSYVGTKNVLQKRNIVSSESSRLHFWVQKHFLDEKPKKTKSIRNFGKYSISDFFFKSAKNFVKTEKFVK